MIYTGNYKNCSSSELFVSISGDCGKMVDFKGNYCKLLAPKLSFWKKWHDNIGKIPELENIYFYIENYYYQVLKNLDINLLFSTLGNSFIMGCYEDNEEFCHRQIVASYLEMLLGIDINEVTIKNNKFIKIPKSQTSIVVKDMLCEIIIKDMENEKYEYDKQMILL